MKLAERDIESDLLDGLLERSLLGSAALAVIIGPVASGKTSMMVALAEKCTVLGAIYIGAIASATERLVPLGVLNQLFCNSALDNETLVREARRLADPELIGSVQDPGPDGLSLVKAEAFAALSKVLIGLSEKTPLVIGIDDIQYTDVVSLQFLSYFSRRASSARVLMVLSESIYTCLTDRQLYAEVLRQANCRYITLAPLSVGGVATLLAERVGADTAGRLAPAYHATTGGNPLLINALADDCGAADGVELGEVIPGSAFRRAVSACLYRYESVAVDVAKAMAVVAGTCDPGLVAELLEVSPELASRGLDALSAGGFVVADGFRHRAIRAAVLADMTACERDTIHRRAAEVLYHTGAPPSAVAEHLIAAVHFDPPWAVQVLREAGEQARMDGQPALELEYLRHAANLSSDRQQRAGVTFSVARAEWRMDPARAARHLPDLVTAMGDGLLDSADLCELACYLLWHGDVANATEAWSVAGRRADGLAAGEAAAGLRDRRTIRNWLNLSYPGLIAGTATADRPGSAPGPAAALPFRKTLAPGFDQEGEASVIAAERSLQGSRLDDPVLASITVALMTLICANRLDRAAFWCRSLMGEAEARRSPLWQAILTAFVAMIETRRGNLVSADRHARTSLNLLTPKAWGVAIGGPIASAVQASIAARRQDEAAAFLRIPVPQAMFRTTYGLLYLQARGEYYLATGRPHAALEDFQSCGERMVDWSLDLSSLVPWRIKAAEVYAKLGDDHHARELTTKQLAELSAGSTRIRGSCLRVLAMASAPGKRLELLREAIEVLRKADARLELAQAFGELSKAYRARGEVVRARVAARQAQSLAEQCGAEQLKAALPQADARVGDSNKCVDPGLVARLSSAERHVAVLATHGYSNREISQKLYITISTVEQHLTRIYRKLGIRSRADLPPDLLPDSA